MNIAVTFENGEIFQHFGHTEQFRVYETDGKSILSKKTIATLGSGHGALAGFLKNLGVETLICGGIGGGARQALDEAGIRIFAGCSGNADDAVSALLAGKLVYNPNELCSHHDEHHGDCGEHGCGHHDHDCGHHDHGCGDHCC